MKNTNNRREELEMAIFILECKDRWTTQDHNDYRQMCAELRQIKQEEA